jgi:predicted XRE-type DNA-binding protein
MLVKAKLVCKISEIVRSRGVTQLEAAKVLALAQPKVSGLLRGQFRGISERKLIGCLSSLGGGRHGSAGAEEPYPPLTAAQLVDIRFRAPKPRGRSVRKKSFGGVFVCLTLEGPLRQAHNWRQAHA